MKRYLNLVVAILGKVKSYIKPILSLIYIKVEYLLIILQSKSLNLSLQIFLYMTPLNYKNFRIHINYFNFCIIKFNIKTFHTNI